MVTPNISGSVVEEVANRAQIAAYCLIEQGIFHRCDGYVAAGLHRLTELNTGGFRALFADPALECAHGDSDGLGNLILTESAHGETPNAE